MVEHYSYQMSMIRSQRPGSWLAKLVIFALALSACTLGNYNIGSPTATHIAGQPIFMPEIPGIARTPLPARPTYKPGELVDYVAQDGDTLPALAARFNTSVDEILSANPNIPHDATTMPPGMPMNMPVYYRALWGNPFHILPDKSFINGPGVIGFSTSAFVASHPGWLKNYSGPCGKALCSGVEIVNRIATNYSLSPRLLLAILEFQGGALSRSEPPVQKNLLGFKRLYYESPYLQLVMAGIALNNGFYGWRAGDLPEFELTDKSLTRPDPWQNAASVAMQYYFSRIYSGDIYAFAIGPLGFYQTYSSLFGDPWVDSLALIPGSLQQPDLSFPFRNGHVWTFTGGPHTSWGKGEPLAALDFAPPSDKSGCFIAADADFATAVADGLVVRSEVDGLALDLDKDGDERTGWVIYYLHLAAEERAPVGAELKKGDPIGYPSCEGGEATGTHVHIARKYNGEWILADGPQAFNLDGWTAHNGTRPYLGTLTRAGRTITACDCSDKYSEIKIEFPE
jgi:LasA protease